MRLLILSVAFLFVFYEAASQESSVPAAVADNFQSAYPNATDVDWDKEGNVYEVEFELDGFENEVTFDESGTIVKQNAEIPVSDLPVEVQNTLDTQFQDREIDEIEKQERDGQIVYQIELEGTLFDDKVTITSNGDVTTDNVAK